MEIDFPNQGEQSDALKKQNALIREGFRVTGYPTLLLCDEKGRPYADLGYKFTRDSEGVLGAIDEKRKLKKLRDVSFAKAESSEGTEKAGHLADALKGVPQQSVSYAYKTTLEEIEALDPNDSTGYFGLLKMRELVGQLSRDMYEMTQEKKFDEAYSAADAFLAEQKPEGEQKQEVLVSLVFALERGGEYARSIDAAKKAIAVDETSDSATMLKNFIPVLEKNLAEQTEPADK